MSLSRVCEFFFFNDTATTEIYTLSLHDALPIYRLRVIPATKVETGVAQKRRASRERLFIPSTAWPEFAAVVAAGVSGRDRKSTRLNSSHANISYAVFCLKKKKDQQHWLHTTHDR